MTITNEDLERYATAGADDIVANLARALLATRARLETCKAERDEANERAKKGALAVIEQARISSRLMAERDGARAANVANEEQIRLGFEATASLERKVRVAKDLYDVTRDERDSFAGSLRALQEQYARVVAERDALDAALAVVLNRHDGWHEADCDEADGGCRDADYLDGADCSCGATGLRRNARRLLRKAAPPAPVPAPTTMDKLRAKVAGMSDAECQSLWTRLTQNVPLEPTHRCSVCGRGWRYHADRSLSLVGPYLGACPDCCDATGDNLVPIAPVSGDEERACGTCDGCEQSGMERES